MRIEPMTFRPAFRSADHYASDNEVVKERERNWGLGEKQGGKETGRERERERGKREGERGGRGRERSGIGTYDFAARIQSAGHYATKGYGP